MVIRRDNGSRRGRGRTKIYHDLQWVGRYTNRE